MKRTRMFSALAAILMTFAATVAHAQSTAPPLELNMLRPTPRTVATPEAGYAMRGNAPLAGNPVILILNFDVSVPAGHQTFFNTAATAWMARIPFYKPTVTGPASITISASEPAIDGAGGILGSAGPTSAISNGGFILTSAGHMQFDSADVANLITAGSYGDVIEHEMGHVLGVGTLWTNNGLYVNNTGQYTGANGLAAWQTRFSGQSAATSVPVELGGGAGTANGHWNEVDGGGAPVGIVEISSGIDMQRETMTGWLNAPLNYSALTHKSMADLGFVPAVGVPVEMMTFTVE